MKKIILLLLTGCCGIMLAVEPHIERNVKTVEQDGRQLTETKREVFFEHGKVIYQTQTEKDKKEVASQKWGGYFFGLEFGRAIRTNGGWSLWNFLEVYYQKNGKYLNAFREFATEDITLIRLGDRTIADFAFLLDEAGADGKASVRMIQFKSHPDWFFIRVKFDSAKYTPWRLNLTAYPGNSDNPKERERWAATKENQYNLSSAAAEFKATSPGLLLFNKFVQEDSGNMIVFNPAQFTKTTISKATAPVITQFFPEKGQTEFFFGISYFSGKPVADIMPRFIGEEADAIAEFMKTIEWNPDMGNSKFSEEAAAFAETLKKMKALGSNVEADEKELAAIQAEYAAALQKNDAAAIAAAMEKLEKLKSKTAKGGLDAFK